MHPPSAIRHLLLAALFCCALPCPAPAGMLEDKNHQELQETLDKIKASQEREGRIRAQTGKLEKSLSSTQKDATYIAAKVQQQERILSEHEDKIAILEAQRREKLAGIQARRAQLSAALSAMIRLARAPKEAVIAQPGSLEKTLKTAEALGLVTQELRRQADELSAELASLDALKVQIETRYREANGKRKDLAKEQEKLTGKIAEGKKLREKLFRDERREGEEIAQLSKKSQSLQELLSSLEDARRKAQASRSNRHPANNRPAEPEAAPDRALRMPAQGRTVQRYGDRKSRGMLIETRGNAQVVAPGKGEVVFTGPFMDYGRMVIVRQVGGLHTLMAGLERIDVSSGDKVASGEPLGRMGAKNAGNRLYLELRKDGHPVDPAPWFK